MLRHSLLRQPGRVVPGWFPLVVEPLRGHLPAPPSPVEEQVHGSRMLLDLDDYVQRKIWYRSYEPAAARALSRLLRPGDTAVDVGANVGFHTLLFARLVGPSGAVHAFEPVNGAILRRNVELNSYEQVVVNEVAVGAGPGTVRIGRRHDPKGPSSGAWTREAAADAVEAEQVSLDDYLGDRPVRLVKVDVEGMEADVVAGLARTLASGRPHALMVEVAGHRMDADELVGPLRAAGYRLTRIAAFGGLRPFREPSRGDRLTGLYHLVAIR